MKNSMLLFILVIFACNCYCYTLKKSFFQDKKGKTIVKSKKQEHNKVFESMKDTTIYQCSCNQYKDSIIFKKVAFRHIDAKKDMYLINFLIPYSSNDTIVIKNKKVWLLKNNGKTDNLNLLFDFINSNYSNRQLDANSGFGTTIELFETHSNINNYQLEGLASHYGYISKLEVSYEFGISYFNWYNGDINYSCKLKK